MPTKRLAWGMQRGRAAAPLPRLRYYTAHLAVSDRVALQHSQDEFAPVHRGHDLRVSDQREIDDMVSIGGFGQTIVDARPGLQRSPEWMPSMGRIPQRPHHPS